ncbi:MAG: tetratricopeptide repeat protein [Gammaproteobacteria bacterium]|nr:tetratricopeptide repeat protein [Gammaproteobacteria bacterium]
MSIFNNRSALLLVILLLGACQSGPDKAPAPKPAVATSPTVEEAAAESSPVDANQVFYQQALASLKSGKTESALKLLRQISNDAPDKPYVFTNLGLAYFKLQQLDLAEEAFKQAIGRNNKDAVAHNHLGILQRQKGQFKQARTHYQRALSIDSGYASAHLNLGILFDIYLQDLKQALRHYQKYQALVSEENSQVAGWIVDIQRRLKSTTTKSQG